MIIYCARNLANGKCYVGQTKKTLDQRKLEHIAKAFRTAPGGPGIRERSGCFQHAIRKYGANSFVWEVLKTCGSSDELSQGEQFFIVQKASLVPSGYNLTSGGERYEVSAATRAKISKHTKLGQTPEIRKQMSASHMGKSSGAKGRKFTRSAEHSHKLSESLRRYFASHPGVRGGERHPRYGVVLSEETKRKISVAKKGSCRTEASRQNQSAAWERRRNLGLSRASANVLRKLEQT